MALDKGPPVSKLRCVGRRPPLLRNPPISFGVHPSNVTQVLVLPPPPISPLPFSLPRNHGEPQPDHFWSFWRRSLPPEVVVGGFLVLEL